MTAEASQLPSLDLQDLWDWSYCPLRVWWRKGDAPSNDDDEAAPLPDALLGGSVRRAIEVYYQANQGDQVELSLAQAFGLVWRRWLRDWTLNDGIVEDLLRYHEERVTILHRFGPDGDQRRPDGSLYRRPTWTRAWREMARERGLDELERKIDRAAQAAGIPRLELPGDSAVTPAMGLAEAFSVALGIVNGLKDLPAPEKVLAVGCPAQSDLLSARLECRLDLVVDLGEKPLRGRPPKGSDGPRMGRRLAYELHLFDEEVPSPASLRHDMRVLALSQALPQNLDLEAEEVKVEHIVVRHMRSGRKEDIRPLEGEGADLLEGLARAVLNGMRGGMYVPRMVCGWRACGDCEYRPKCFAGQGIMQAFNPPLQEQIQSNQRAQRELRELLEHDRGGKALVACRDFANWMAGTPGMSPEGSLWLLNALESEVP